MNDKQFMLRAIALSEEAVEKGHGGPFGAVIVKDGQIIAEGCNRVTSRNDPTAHAEMVAIRNACRELSSFSLQGCDIYATCEPCPMCLAAIYWASIDRLYYANSRTDAAQIGFDDERIYNELARPITERTIPATRMMAHEALATFRHWEDKPDKLMY